MRWCVPLALWLALFAVSFNVYVMTVAVVPVARDLRTTLGSVHPPGHGYHLIGSIILIDIQNGVRIARPTRTNKKGTVGATSHRTSVGYALGKIPDLKTWGKVI